MTEELVKTCENCEYEHEDMEGTHCRHCIHNAEEHFEPKTCYVKEKEIREKVINEFAEKIELEISESIIWGILFDFHKKNVDGCDASDKIVDYVIDTSRNIAEKLKGGV